MAEVLPSYDRDRVHASDIKKLIQWYNILVNNGITEFITVEEEEATEE
jgi:dephospho-CoA kinase